MLTFGKESRHYVDDRSGELVVFQADTTNLLEFCEAPPALGLEPSDGSPDHVQVPLLLACPEPLLLLVYALPDLSPGRYQVRWKVLSADGHLTEGAVRFVVEDR